MKGHKMEAVEEYSNEALKKAKALELYIKNYMLPKLAGWTATSKEDKKENKLDKEILGQFTYKDIL